MGDGLLFLILLVSATAAVLAGMAVFSNNRPPDGRLHQVIEDLAATRETLSQVQKSLLQLERKIEKDGKDNRAELKDLLEKMAERLDKRLSELA